MIMNLLSLAVLVAWGVCFTQIAARSNSQSDFIPSVAAVLGSILVCAIVLVR